MTNTCFSILLQEKKDFLRMKIIFLATVFIRLSIPMEKNKKNWIWFFLELWLVEKITEKKIFPSDLEISTKVNRIFSASQFTDLSISMTKKSKNWIWFFPEFWLVEKIW